MTSIIIKEVKTKKEIKDFIVFPTKMFKDVPNYCPCFYSDELKVLNRLTTYEKESKTIFYIAYKDNKVVGRIQALIQYTYNKKMNIKQARFTRFDCINDFEVAKALFDAATKWAISEGMESIVGPLDYSDLEREGLLIEGFDEYMTFEEQYHPPYYQELIEQYGFTKDIDWLEFELRFNEESAGKLERLAKAAKRFAKVRLAPKTNKKKYINTYKKPVFKLIDECYGKLYGTMPLSEETVDSIINQFSLVLEPEFLPIALNEKDEVIGFALCVPSISPALRKSGGKLTIPTLFRLLKCLRKPKCAELCLVAVRPDYQKLGVNALFLDAMAKTIKARGIEFCETNLNLETNDAVMSQWKQFHARHHKRRRCYILSFNK